jgi:ankyrin repeat protein
MEREEKEESTSGRELYQALYKAVSKGEEPVAQALLEQGAPVEWPREVTPLYSATQRGYFNLVRLLVRYKADVNISRGKGYREVSLSPLCAALERGHDALALFLVEHGADPGNPACFNNRGNFLSHAFLNNKDALVRALFKYGVQGDTYVSEEDIFLVSISKKHIIESCFADPLERAAVAGDYFRVARLLSALHERALERERVHASYSIVQRILDYYRSYKRWLANMLPGPPSLKPGFYHWYTPEEGHQLSQALAYAAGQGHVDIVNVLLSYHACPFHALSVIRVICSRHERTCPNSCTLYIRELLESVAHSLVAPLSEPLPETYLALLPSELRSIIIAYVTAGDISNGL